MITLSVVPDVRSTTGMATRITERSWWWVSSFTMRYTYTSPLNYLRESLHYSGWCVKSRVPHGMAYARADTRLVRFLFYSFSMHCSSGQISRHAETKLTLLLRSELMLSAIRTLHVHRSSASWALVGALSHATWPGSIVAIPHAVENHASLAKPCQLSILPLWQYKQTFIELFVGMHPKPNVNFATPFGPTTIRLVVTASFITKHMSRKSRV